jgi:hypothetical protein
MVARKRKKKKKKKGQIRRGPRACPHITRRFPTSLCFLKSPAPL